MSGNDPQIGVVESRLPVPQPKIGKPKQKRKAMTEVEANAAAKELGLNLIKGKYITKAQELGRFLEESGAIQVSRSLYLLTTEHALLASNKVMEMLDESGDPEMTLSLFKAHQGYLSVVQAAANGIAKANQIVEPAEGEVVRMPPPPGAVVQITTSAPLQVNQHAP